MTLFPIVDQTYAYVCREDVRQAVKMGSSAPTGAGLAVKSAPRSGPTSHPRQSHNSSTVAYIQIQSYVTGVELRARKLRETVSSSGRVALVSTKPQLALFLQVDPTNSSTPLDDSGVGTDFLTKEIIGHGTKIKGFYYMDDFSIGGANSVKHPHVALSMRQLAPRHYNNIVLPNERIAISVKQPALFSLVAMFLVITGMMLSSLLYTLSTAFLLGS
ncbi:hypothetical protein L3X38_026433 [Prunus dulcis]|uniref:Uncharacterized protein n=1 Tax=Prunus dulcis TaxID=3755 RepID=A0AAD4YYG5_PRUDU|nr:hypothetical protein L3X38_026433 [Prunus dulcis]